MFNAVLFSRVECSDSRDMAEIAQFLSANGLDLDPAAEIFITAARGGRLLACGGLAGNIIKCVAIDESARGEGLALQLATELITLAYERGAADLFIYTKIEYEKLFAQCGFHTLASVPHIMVLMENSSARLRRYLQELAQMRRPGAKIGCIVMNANPFTKGHLYLAEQAAKHCDWLHLFLVKEDASSFPFADRMAMARAGTAHIDRLTFHEGSEYIISRATFPCYFLKEIETAQRCYIELDVKIFRRYIALALGITHRFVGTEPYCPLTAQYNRSLRYWLKSRSELPAPAIELVELQRLEENGAPISASSLRAVLKAALKTGDLRAAAPFVPASTFAHLQKMQAEGRLSAILNRPAAALSPLAIGAL